MSITIATQMLVVAVAILQRQELHNSAVINNDWANLYDYIVVGAGTAGSVVASRLSENGRNTVLLLEAGGPASLLGDMPAAYSDNLVGNDWGYYTQPQKKASKMYKGASAPMLRGKVIGGTGMLNMMAINRGNSRDFDLWSTKYGATEWNYEKLLPYFKMTETLYNTSSPQFSDSYDYRGHSGPISSSLPQNADPIHIEFVNLWQSVGHPIGDFNGPSQMVSGVFSQAIDPHTWTRSSSAHAYLYPSLNRTNLNIIAKAHVTKVIMNDKQAWGVEFERNGRRYEVRARKEVILSAGVINTPQLLMLSGIGPKSELDKHGIPLIEDLPVGQQFQDHINVPLPFLVKNESLIQWSRDTDSLLQSADHLYDYYIYNTGPLTQLIFSGSYYSSIRNPIPEWPDVIFFLYISQITSEIIESTSGTVDPVAWKGYYEPLLNDDRHFEIMASLYRIYSRGTVKLASSDPFDKPLIDPNYYSDSRDENAQLDALKKIYELTARSEFSKYAIPYDRPIPGCVKEYRDCLGKHLKNCCRYLQCYIRHRAVTGSHPTSTAPIGTHEYAVVDNYLRVHGIKSLRVIDASVIPEVPNGNTNSITLAIAEKGSEMVLNGH